MTDSAVDRLKRVRDRMNEAARRAGRDPAAITLIAVTKTVSIDRILPYVAAGAGHVGENRVQEALEKYNTGHEAWNVKPTFHLIGPLQSNKAKKAAGFFDCVQSLDRMDIAQELDQHARAMNKTLDGLVQVKLGDEATKSGLDPNTLPEFLEKLQGLKNLRVRGLMGIPPLAAQAEAARPYFQRLRKLFENAPRLSSSVFDVLSMGMSSDFETAIEEGSTMVRIGSALFGPRDTRLK